MNVVQLESNYWLQESDLTDIGGVMGLRKFESQIIAVELSPEGGLEWY